MTHIGPILRRQNEIPTAHKLLTISLKGQSAIEYLTTYGWMLLVIVIVSGAIFTTVQGSTQINANGFDQGNLGYVRGGFADNGFQFELRNQEANQIRVNKITLSSEETGDKVTLKPLETLPVGETATFSTVGLVNTNTRSKVNIQTNYDKGGLEGLVSEGSLRGSFKLNTERAGPESGEWEFVDVSKINQSTVDTDSMSDFYIMKYEASRKDANSTTQGSSNMPSSQQGVAPWSDITQNEAIDACKRIGDDFKLQSNKQYQVATGAVIGNQSTFVRGNTNKTKSYEDSSEKCTPDPTEENGFLGQGRCLTGTGPDSWNSKFGVADLNGNLIEITSGFHGDGSDWDLNAKGYITGWNSRDARPTSLQGSGDSDFDGDRYFGPMSSDDGVVRRGGMWRNQKDAGPFYLSHTVDESTSQYIQGFRCVMTP